MRILVTGGAGFIGSHTVDLLLKQGKEVIVLDNLSSGKLNYLPLSHPNLEFIEGDILEYPFVEELASRSDAILHLAAIVSVPVSFENPIYSFQVNMQGFLHVLQSVLKAKRPMRVVYASSAAVYGDAKTLPCRDDQPLTNQPLSPYALQKIQDETFAEFYGRLLGIKSLGLRYFNVYGERQSSDSSYSGVISRFVEAYRNDQTLTIYGDGQQSRDFIHVSDVAHANVQALESDYEGVLNIATGHSQTLLDLVRHLEFIGQKKAKVQFEPERRGDIPCSYAMTQWAEHQLKFKASTSLTEGLRKCYDDGHPVAGEDHGKF